MAKTYIGVGGKAKRVRKIFLGIGGKAKRVKKAYVGDANGKARLVFALFAWEKWNAGQNHLTYYYRQNQGSSSEWSDPTYIYEVYSSWDVDYYTGNVTLGTLRSGTITQCVGGYTAAGKFITSVAPDGYSYNYTQYGVGSDTLEYYSKGSTDYGEVYGDTENAYPNNGEQGGYWYVKKT